MIVVEPEIKRPKRTNRARTRARSRAAHSEPQNRRRQVHASPINRSATIHRSPVLATCLVYTNLVKYFPVPDVSPIPSRSPVARLSPRTPSPGLRNTSYGTIYIFFYIFNA